MIFEFDDFGCNHEISDQCQSHDCRDVLELLKKANENFKVTLFSIPGEMTMELLGWAQANADWVQLGVHGFFHSSNYECAEMSYGDFGWMMGQFSPIIDGNFTKIFRAPGWQISDDAMKWLQKKGWIIADQGYNDDRRPEYMNSYINYDNKFKAKNKSDEVTDIEAWHGHTWNCVGNGIYETYDMLEEMVKATTDFKFIGELF